jgi:hypothetical protein
VRGEDGADHAEEEQVLAAADPEDVAREEEVVDLG